MSPPRKYQLDKKKTTSKKRKIYVLKLSKVSLERFQNTFINEVYLERLLLNSLSFLKYLMNVEKAFIRTSFTTTNTYKRKTGL